MFVGWGPKSNGLTALAMLCPTKKRWIFRIPELNEFIAKHLFRAGGEKACDLERIQASGCGIEVLIEVHSSYLC